VSFFFFFFGGGGGGGGPLDMGPRERALHTESDRDHCCATAVVDAGCDAGPETAKRITRRSRAGKTWSQPHRDASRSASGRPPSIVPTRRLGHHRARHRRKYLPRPRRQPARTSRPRHHLTTHPHPIGKQDHTSAPSNAPTNLPMYRPPPHNTNGAAATSAMRSAYSNHASGQSVRARFGRRC